MRRVPLLLAALLVTTALGTPAVHADPVVLGSPCRAVATLPPRSEWPYVGVITGTFFVLPEDNPVGFFAWANCILSYTCNGEPGGIVRFATASSTTHVVSVSSEFTFFKPGSCNNLGFVVCTEVFVSTVMGGYDYDLGCAEAETEAATSGSATYVTGSNRRLVFGRITIWDDGFGPQFRVTDVLLTDFNCGWASVFTQESVVCVPLPSPVTWYCDLLVATAVTDVSGVAQTIATCDGDTRSQAVTTLVRGGGDTQRWFKHVEDVWQVRCDVRGDPDFGGPHARWVADCFEPSQPLSP